MDNLKATEIYRLIDEEYQDSFVCAPIFNEEVCTEPFVISESDYEHLKLRFDTTQTFFKKSLELFEASLRGDLEPSLTGFLLNDAFGWREVTFYEEFREFTCQTPRFYRTDESSNGKILELQCPGSGWGDLELLRRVYQGIGLADRVSGFIPAKRISDDISKLCGVMNPSVFHMLDNASNPSSMRYLFSVTQPPLRYWGYHPSVKYGHVNFIRSHSVRSLFAENFFEARISETGSRRPFFDLPPNPIFDQKMLLCLPFMRSTRRYFPDSVRNAIAYTAPIVDDGFEDEDGTRHSLRELAEIPRSRRRFYLKYGGCDTNLNWGSKAVWRLDGTQKDVGRIIGTVLQDTRAGRPWIIQREEAQKSKVGVWSRNSEEFDVSNRTSKISCFYGPSGLIGIRAMFSRFYKVHGQPSTALSLVLT